MSCSRNRLWVLSEVFYPEETGTGHYITKIAEHLASTRDVATLCAQPSYSKAGSKFPARETHKGVEIYRCPGLIFRRKRLILQSIKIVSITISLFLNALFRVRKGDSILVVTNPPTLPLMAALISVLRGIPYTIVVHDMYPEMLEACGLVKPDSLIYRLFLRINRFVLRRARKITTIGTDMSEHLTSARATGTSDGISVIPLWSDCWEVHPKPKQENVLLHQLKLEDKFVVLYAGNMGSPHQIETIAGITRTLAVCEEIHFLFIGSGTQRNVIENLAASGARNITILQPRARADQEEFLNACDLSILSLSSRMLGLAVPSRTYNIMAAGKPLVALVPPRSETARVVRDEKIGWVIEPGDADSAVAAILEAKENPQLLREMGARGRTCAEKKYSPESVLGHFEPLMEPSNNLRVLPL